MELTEIRARISEGCSLRDLPLRVAYYARVSTEKEEQLHSLQQQKKYYESYIRDNPNWKFSGGFVDEGKSGGSVEHRTEFLRMLRCAENREFDYIITKEISRFSRDTLDSIRFTRKLLEYGVGIFFQNDQINTLMPDAELRLTIMASLAQDERRRISERVRFGLRRSIENGHVLGNSAIWGYKKQNGTLVVVPEEAEIVREIFSCYADRCMGLRTISRHLTEMGASSGTGSPFSAATVKNILQNPKYKGTYCGNKTEKTDYRSRTVRKLPKEQWKVIDDHEAVPAIVSAELWQRANDRLHKNGAEAVPKAQYTFSGHVFCGEHGCAYHRSQYRSGREVWHCSRYARQGNAGCTVPAIYTEELLQTAVLYLKALFPKTAGLCRIAMGLLRRTLQPEQGRELALQKAVSDAVNFENGVSKVLFDALKIRMTVNGDADGLRHVQISVPDGPTGIYAVLREKGKTSVWCESYI